MSFNVQSFRSALVYGGARPNQFDITLPFPLFAVGGDSAQFTMMARAASLPSEDVSPIEVGYFGRQIKVPGDRTFPSWTVTIINDEDFKLRDAFERWSSAINSHVGNLRAKYALLAMDYSVDAIVTQYGKTGDAIKDYDMVGCWPSAVSAIDVDWNTNNTIEEFQVEFQYQWWESRTTDHY